VRCPCCKQMAKVYRRKVNSGMAFSLLSMYRLAGTSYLHLPTRLNARSREEGKLRYWGLVEEELEKRPDGGRAGYWRVTEKGRHFIFGSIGVPKYARIYDSRLLGFDGPEVLFRDCLGSKFNYDELMAGI